MEPHIRYARTADGVSIAYWVYGAGPPLVLSPHGMMSHIVEQFRQPQMHRWFTLLAERYTVLQYDYRGFGSSQRNVSGISFETTLSDIETVVSHADFERFALFGSMINGAIACAYAEKYPARVSHLILWSAGWGGPRSESAKAMASIDDIATTDWALYARLRMQAQWGWSDPEQARAYTRIFRDSTDAKTYLETLDVWKTIDLAGVLGGLKVPALVVRSNARSAPDSDGGSQQLAATIPGARLVTVRGRDWVPWLSEEAADEGIRIVAEFLEGVSLEHVPAPEKIATGTAIILFADVVDSTALTERIGDAAFREKSRELDGAMRGIISKCGGSVIDAKTLGDGVLATFPAASQGIAAALQMEGAAAASGLQLHVGLHAGDVIREPDASGRANVFGGAVNIAARISSMSTANEVLVSATVRDLARTSAGVTFEDRGEQSLKGVAEPVRVFAVRPSPTGENKKNTIDLSG